MKPGRTSLWLEMIVPATIAGWVAGMFLLSRLLFGSEPWSACLGDTHVWQAGDTYFQIAEATHQREGILRVCNAMPVGELQPGQKIRIPNRAVFYLLAVGVVMTLFAWASPVSPRKLIKIAAPTAFVAWPLTAYTFGGKVWSACLGPVIKVPDPTTLNPNPIVDLVELHKLPHVVFVAVCNGHLWGDFQPPPGTEIVVPNPLGLLAYLVVLPVVAVLVWIRVD